MFRDLIKTFRAGISGEGARGQLARTGFGTMGVSVIGTGVSFAVSVLLARSLGTEGYGIYAFAMSVVVLLVVPATVGLPQLMVREVAARREAGSWERLRGEMLGADLTTLLSSVVVAGLGAALLWTGWLGTDEATRTTLLWAMALLPVFGLEQVHGSMLRGLSLVVRGQIPGSIVRPALLALLVLAAIATDVVPVTPGSVMGLHVIAAVVALSLASFWLLKGAPPQLRSVRSSGAGRHLVYAAVPFLGLQLLSVVNSQVDILLLGVLAPADEVGIYRVAIAVAAFVNFFLSAANLVVQPEVSRLYSSGKLEAVQRLVTGQARVVAVATVPLAGLFVLAGTPFLRIVYGAEYLDAYLPLLILIAGQIVNVMMGPVGLVLNMTGHEGETIRGYVLATTWAVVANLVLIPIWGLIGAAVAHASAIAFWNVYLAMRVRRKVGISSTAWGRRPD